ncbi:solute carrier family 2, facilitated glucose transporter member 4-like [Lagopus muta]|uniref:solute carrier family 2, facilitated glucose transporter member 4-like n=1 Tax=Lagopus muta TaxID=64668 RepID=UPI00209E9ED8|nr:solute carrier family 2, facilitated glucose transporter member 4-like [Lagopus muta]
MLVCAVSLSVSLRLQDSPGAGAVSLLGVFLFVAFFELGPGPIPWFLAAELFPQGPRPAAVALAGAANWAGNFVVGMAFPGLQHALGPLVFVLFAAMLAASWLFAFLLLPETRGRPFEGGGGRRRHSGPPPSPPAPPPRDPPSILCWEGGGEGKGGTELQPLRGGEDG